MPSFLNGTNADFSAWNKAIGYIQTTPQGAFLVNQLFMSPLMVKFNSKGDMSYNNITKILNFDPNSAMTVIGPDGTIGAQSPALGLLHELYHWYTKTITGDFDEYLALHYETQAALQLGEPIRADYNSVYSGNPFPWVDDVTSHTSGGYWQKVDAGEVEVGPQYDPNVKVITETGSGGGPRGPEEETEPGGIDPDPSVPDWPYHRLTVDEPIPDSYHATTLSEQIPVEIIGIPEISTI
jgi:hypothetical protein